MKINYFLAGLLLGTMVLSSCGSETTKTTETKKTETKEEVKEEKVEETVNEDDKYLEQSLKSQWSDIVLQLKDGKKENLNMYLDKYAEGYSQENWDLLDFSHQEYYTTFNKYTTYSELPDATNRTQPTKVVSVSFKTDVKGVVTESSAMIYLEERGGLIWIVGCELAG